jgi:hypothetical protein
VGVFWKPCEPIRPLERSKDVLNGFKGIKTDHDVLHFIERFGPLTQNGFDTDRGELVETVKEHSKAFCDWVNLERSSDTKDARRLGEQIKKFARLKTTLIGEDSRELRLRIVPIDLLSALWLQLADVVGEHGKLIACQYCGTFFHAGVGTDRRLDAKFCSKEHQIEYSSLQRSRPKQSNRV